MTEQYQYPKGSILSQMQFEMYASTVRNQITVFHNASFRKGLREIEFIRADRDLIFIYKDGEKDNFGGYVDQGIVPFLNKANEIHLFQVDEKQKKPTIGQTIPLKII